MLLVGSDHLNENPTQRSRDVRPESRRAAQLEGQRQYPLPNRNRRQHAVYQVRRRAAHPPLTTARTYPAALAREGDEEIAAAIVAMKAQ